MQFQEIQLDKCYTIAHKKLHNSYISLLIYPIRPPSNPTICEYCNLLRELCNILNLRRTELYDWKGSN
jgi:hypothetical protein